MFESSIPLLLFALVGTIAVPLALLYFAGFDPPTGRDDQRPEGRSDQDSGAALDQDSGAALDQAFDPGYEDVDGFLVVLDESGSVRRTDAAAQSVVDAEPATVVGKHFSETPWANRISAPASELRRRLDRAVSGASVRFETGFRRACGDGQDVFEILFQPVADSEEVVEIVVVGRDVTEQRARERELEFRRSLLEAQHRATLDGIIGVDSNREVLFYDERFTELWGIPEEIVEHGDDEDALEWAIDRVKQPEEFLERIEYLYDHPENTSRDEIELEDGRVFDRYSGPIVGDDGTHFGRLWTFRDITERKERERRLNELLNAVSELVVADGESAVAEIVATATEEILGFEVTAVHLYDPDEETLVACASTERTRKLFDPIPEWGPGDRPMELFREGEPDNYTATASCPVESAVVLPIETYGTLSIASVEPEAFEDADLTMAELLAKNAAAALDQIERRQELQEYETVLDTVQDMVYVLDADGYVQLVTDPLAAFLGYDREVLVGEHVSAVLDERTAERARERIRGLVESDRESATVETEVTKASGETVPVEAEMSLLPSDGGFRGVVGVVRDRSELYEVLDRVETERDRFEYLFDHLPDAVVEVALTDEGEPIVESANPAFESTFGYDLQEIRGENLDEYVLPPGAASETHEAADETRGVADETRGWSERALGGEPIQTEVRRVTAEGVREFLLRRLSYTRDGERFGFEIYTDITDQKRYERYLEVVNRLLRHNLRNDLNVIGGYATLIAERADDPQLVSSARTLNETAAELTRLGKEATALERTLGRCQPVDSGTAVGDVFNEIVDRYEERASVTFAEPGSLAVATDGQLTRIMTVLVEHAIDESTDAPTIWLDATALSDRWIEFEITDDGPGFPEVERAVVTGRTRISQLTHASGLTLWQVRWLAESAGGEIDVEASSEETTTIVRLPRYQPELAEDEHPQADERQQYSDDTNHEQDSPT